MNKLKQARRRLEMAKRLEWFSDQVEDHYEERWIDGCLYAKRWNGILHHWEVALLWGKPKRTLGSNPAEGQLNIFS